MLPIKYQHREGVNEEVRFCHEECGDTRDRLYVKRTSKGWYHHCHNCAPKMSGFTRDTELLSPSEIKQVLEKPPQNQVVKASEIELPKDFTTDIPAPGLAWLYKYGITDDELSRYRFGYSSIYNRLIMPVYDDRSKGTAEPQLLYWQGRRLDPKQNPKYINTKAGGRDVYFRVLDRISEKCIPWVSNHKYITLVEDIVSAIKVGRVYPAIGLLGSYIPDSLIRELSTRNLVKIWLDDDKWKEALNYSRTLSSRLGIPVTPIRTPLDPKEYSTDEISRILDCR